MTEAQIRVAYKLYERGLSLTQLGELLWARFEYTNPNSCTASLYSAFKTRKLQIRSRADSIKLRAEKKSQPPLPKLQDPSKKISPVLNEPMRKLIRQKRDENKRQVLKRGPKPVSQTAQKRVRCQGRTQDQNQCEFKAVTGELFCRLHDGQYIHPMHREG